MLYSTLLVATLVTVASAASTTPADPTFPPTKMGVKCQFPGDSPPRCPNGFFCPSKQPTRGFCYEQLSLGMPCYREWKDCASPNYCRRDWNIKEPGKCTARSVEGASCGGKFGEICDNKLQCLSPDGKWETAGKCVSVPRRTGEVCNGNTYCSEGDYCQLKAKDVSVGVCTRRANVKEECGDNERYPTLAPPCAKGLGCYITAEGGKGVCYSNYAELGAKCSSYGSLYCKKGLFCRYADGGYYGTCDKVRQLNEKCVYNFKHEVPCADKLSCYFEDNDMDGVCLKTSDNPIGAKCTDFGVNCADNAYCKLVAGKRFGLCTRSLASGEKCTDTTVDAAATPCTRELACYHEDDAKNGVCVKSWGNPIGAKCLNYTVRCTGGAECKTEGKNLYGVCVKSVPHKP